VSIRENPWQAFMSSQTLLQAIRNQTPLIGDGAMGTELQKAGLEPGGCGDEWNLVHPERVLRIQRAYVDAGSQCLITNTFGSNRFVLARYELQDKVREIALAGARIAREAMGDRGWVLGDVGPCGGFLEPLGEITEAELAASLRDQIGGLLAGGADAIILETITALDELELGIRIARELNAPCVIASMAFDKLKDGTFRTMMGVTPEQAAATAKDADVLAANCGTGLQPLDFVGIARQYRAVSDKPIMLQPNAGQPRLEGTDVVYPVSPVEIAPELIALSREAQIVGACCGSSPAHIAEFARIKN
jgi:5-methyltetrahydrofolate--homocysteine methyltransferase